MNIFTRFFLRSTLVVVFLLDSAALLAIDPLDPNYEKIVNTFDQSQDIIDARSALNSLFPKGSMSFDNPQVAFISRSCGFAGCYDRYLVTQSYNANVVNFQMKSLMAVVNISSYATPTLEVVDGFIYR